MSFFAELKDERVEILGLSDIKPKHLHHDIIGPRNNKAYEKSRSENSSPDGYLMFLLGYASSRFRYFESYLIIFVGLDGKNIQLF